MPHIAHRDATRILPLLDHVEDLLERLTESGRRYRQHIQESTALSGEIREALVANGDAIADACERMHVWAFKRIAGIRQVTELGADAAAEGAGHITSVEIPEFF